MSRLLVVNADDLGLTAGVCRAVGRAHAEVFGDVRPATAMVEVSRLLHPDMLVEIEASAYLPPERDR